MGWDGGSSGCNSPDMLLYTECKNWTDDIQMLSILCGYADWPFANQSMVNPSIINVAKATLYMVYKCVQNNAIWKAQSILKDNHVLLNTYLGKGFNIDDASPFTQTSELAIWQKLLNDNPNIFSKFIKK